MYSLTSSVLVDAVAAALGSHRLRRLSQLGIRVHKGKSDIRRLPRIVVACHHRLSVESVMGIGRHKGDDPVYFTTEPPALNSRTAVRSPGDGTTLFQAW